MLRPTSRVRRSAFFRTLSRLCRQYQKWYGNSSYKADKNGERWLLERLRDGRFETIVDVGANVGKWASLAARTFPAAATYALEIVPATFAELSTAVQHMPSIHPINLGLADHVGRLRVRYNPQASAHTTFTEYPHNWIGESLECEVTTGDAFLEAHGLTTVDFLKIDVEGAEHLVLRGLERTLAQRRVRFVQLEYGLVNILTGFLLRHFYELFADHGYVVGKIYPDYVDFRDYRLEDEDFLGPNYLACRREDPLLTVLRGG